MCKTHGGWILKTFVVFVGLILSLLKIKKWINEADTERIKSTIQSELIVHCPLTHSIIEKKIDELHQTVKDCSPNGELMEIKTMLRRVLENR